MKELQEIYNKYNANLENYSYPKTTITGKTEWEKFRYDTYSQFADEIDAKCAELVNLKKGELKKEANRLLGELRRLELKRL